MTRAHSARPVAKFSPGTDRQPSWSSSGSGMTSGIPSVSSTGSTTTPRRIVRVSSSGQSKTNSRRSTPTWLAASPTPFAAAIVSNMSSTSVRTVSSTVPTGRVGVWSTGSPTMRMRRTVTGAAYGRRRT